MAVSWIKPIKLNPRLQMTLPVLTKEMRSRMRGVRGPMLLFVATALAILVGFIILGLAWDHIDAVTASGSSYLGAMGEIGRALFIGLTMLEAVLAALIAPALTAGAISLEREQQTFDLLLLTRLSSANIVLGKLLSALGFIGIMVLCALPVGAICFMLGGVDPAQLLWALALILAVTLLFGAIGLCCSALFQRTAVAVAVAYATVVVWLGTIPLALWLEDHSYFFSRWLDNPSLNATLIFATSAVILAPMIPTVLACTIASALCMRKLQRVTWLAVYWLFLLGVPLVMLVFTFIDFRLEYGLVGNPILAFIALFNPDADIIRHLNDTFVQYWLTPVTIGWHLLLAWLLLLLSARRVDRLRR